MGPNVHFKDSHLFCVFSLALLRGPGASYSCADGSSAAGISLLPAAFPDSRTSASALFCCILNSLLLCFPRWLISPIQVSSVFFVGLLIPLLVGGGGEISILNAMVKWKTSIF